MVSSSDDAVSGDCERARTADKSGSEWCMRDSLRDSSSDCGRNTGKSEP